MVKNSKTKEIGLIAFLFLCCIASTQVVSAQNKTAELKLKLSIYIGAEDESTANFESANFFLLKKNPVALLKEMKLEDSFVENSSDKRKKISDDLYLKAASLILLETDNTKSLMNYVAGWNYDSEDEEIDEDLEILSFVINNKLKKNLISEIRFDNLLNSYRLRVPEQKSYLFGFCRVGEDIVVWNHSVSGDEKDIELDQYNAEFIFSQKEFEQEIDKL